MVRTLGLLSVLMLVACGSSSGSTSASSASASCNPQGSHTIASGEKARVYSLRKLVYGCAYATGKAWRLGEQSACGPGSDGVQAAHVAAALAGYGLRSCGVDSGSAVVIVRRLTDGKQLVERAATERSTGAESYQSVGSLALKADRSVAWIGVGQSIIGHGKTVEVRRFQSGQETLLDSGSAVDPASLRLHGSTLTWKHGKQTRSATLD